MYIYIYMRSKQQACLRTRTHTHTDTYIHKVGTFIIKTQLLILYYNK